MSRLPRDGTTEPVSRDQIIRYARGQGNVHFPCSADHEQDWQPYPVDPYSAICDDHTYIYTYIHTNERKVCTHVNPVSIHPRQSWGEMSECQRGNICSKNKNSSWDFIGFPSNRSSIYIRFNIRIFSGRFEYACKATNASRFFLNQ